MRTNASAASRPRTIESTPFPWYAVQLAKAFPARNIRSGACHAAHSGTTSRTNASSSPASSASGLTSSGTAFMTSAWRSRLASSESSPAVSTVSGGSFFTAVVNECSPGRYVRKTRASRKSVPMTLSGVISSAHRPTMWRSHAL